LLDLLTAAPKDIAFGDRTFKVGALKMRELGLLQRWIRDHAVRPTVKAKAEAELLDPADRRELMKQAVFAEREWPPAIGSAEGNRMLLTDPDGQRRFLAVMLGKYQALTDTDIDAVLAGVSEEDFGVLVAIAFGEDDLDPEQARARVTERLQEVAATLARMLASESEATAPTGENASST